MARNVLLLCFLTAVGVALAQAELTDDEIRGILRDRVDRGKKTVGIVVGLVDDKGVRIISYGKPHRGGRSIPERSGAYRPSRPSARDGYCG